MSPTESPTQHDRALLLSASTVAIPTVLGLVMMVIYVTRDNVNPGPLLLAGTGILSVTAAAAAILQSQRRTRARIAELREEVAESRSEVKALRVESATAELASMVAEVVPITRANGHHVRN